MDDRVTGYGTNERVGTPRMVAAVSPESPNSDRRKAGVFDAEMTRSRQRIFRSATRNCSDIVGSGLLALGP